MLFENKKMTLEEKLKFFLSEHFRILLEKLAKMYCKNPKIAIVSSSTTCTDGKVIYENFENEVFLDPKLSKITTTLCYLSDIFHEYGHWEESMFEIMWAIQKDDWSAAFLTTREKREIEKLVVPYVKNLSMYQRHALADIYNIVDDAGMEYNQSIKKGAFVKKCFTMGNAIVMNSRPTLNELARKNVSKYKLLLEAVLCFSILHHIKGTFEDEELETIFFERLLPLAKNAKFLTSPFERFECAKEIFEVLKPFLEEQQKDDKSPYENTSKSSEQKQDNGNGASNRQEPQTSNENNSNENGSNKNGNGSSAPSENENNNDVNNHDISQNDFDGIIEELSEINDKHIEEQIKQGIRQIEARMKIETEEKMKSFNDDISFQMLSGKDMGNNFGNKGSSCIDALVNIEASSPMLKNDEFYETIVRENSSIISIFTSYFETLLKPRPSKKVYTNTGSKIATKRLPQYKFNTNLYEEKITKKSIAPFSVVMLLDVSGSMNSTANQETLETRLDLSKKTAIILNEVFTSLKIPFAILTHSATFPTVEMKCYKNFNTSTMEKGRIACISTSSKCGANRDGVALRFVKEFIKNRKERIIVLSISDGKPNDSGYTGQAAIDDTKKAADNLSLFAKVIGISISDTNEEVNPVAEIYKESIIVKNLSELPGRLLNKIS